MINVSPITVQAAKGSPLRPWGHLQMGLWLTTEHSALTPQLPGQGSLHFWLTQALESSQSELTTHSGRQVGGLPIKPSIHLQTAIPFTSWQWLFGPQGDGEQGFCIVSSWTGEQETKAFPDMPAGQLHMGMWLIVWHCAFCPQVPMHGSMHLFLIHALSRAQSVFITHSGRQPL